MNRLSAFACLLMFSTVTWGEDRPPREPITEAEAIEFCEEFAIRFLDGDGPWLNDHIDVAGMIWRATDNEQDDFAKAFRREVLQKKNGQVLTIREFTQSKDQFEDYRFRRLRQVDGTWKATFRLMLVGGGVNYHEADLVRKANGELGVSELYIYLTGETLTDAYRTRFKQAAEKLRADPQTAARTSAAYGRVANMQKALHGGDHAKVLELYDKLPEDIQKSKNVAIIRVQAAATQGEEAYAKVLEEYQKSFPDDSSLDMVLLDAFFLAKKYDAFRNTVDRLNNRLGGDGYLAFLKATSYFVEEKPEDAIAVARVGMAEEEDFQKLYEITLNASLKAKKHALTKEMLEKLEADFEMAFGDLKSVPQYKDFCESPEYEQWAQDHDFDSTEEPSDEKSEF